MYFLACVGCLKDDQTGRDHIDTLVGSARARSSVADEVTSMNGRSMIGRSKTLCCSMPSAGRGLNRL